jgi:hypothetical protein
MNDIELDRKVAGLLELKQIAKQLKVLIEDLENEIKAEMTLRDKDTLTGSDWKIVWKERTVTRLDKELLEKELGDLSKYKKITTYKSFYLKKI